MKTDNDEIVDAMSDQEVLDVICHELNRRLPSYDDLDKYVEALRGLPEGLRAMAATHQLDVSITLDDLGWHFGNWHHHGYAAETARGLRVLGADRAAELFEIAHGLASQHWARLGEDDWMEWYHGSPLEQAVEPVNRAMWDLFPADAEQRIMQWWVDYARSNPQLLRREPGRPTRR